MSILFKPNKFIKYLILSDLAFWTGWGLLTPIFAIFIVNNIKGGSAFVVGMASAAFWLTRSLFRVPIGMLVDAYPSEKDDYFVMIAGFFIASLVPFGYIFASVPWHVYFLQACYGLGLAMSYSGWTGIFTRHIDHGRESTEWGLNATCIGVGIGLAGAVGGWAVSRFSFESVFIAVGTISFMSVLILLVLKNDIKGTFKNGQSFSAKDSPNGLQP